MIEDGSAGNELSYGEEFVKFVNFMTEVANQTNPVVYKVDRAQEVLKDLPKRRYVFLKNRAYSSRKWEFIAGIETLLKTPREMFLKTYGRPVSLDSRNEAWLNDAMNNVPKTVTKADSWVNLYAELHTGSGLLTGYMKDTACSEHPFIGVKLKTNYESDPIEVLKGIHKTNFYVEPKVDFGLGTLPDEKGESWLEAFLNNPKEFLGSELEGKRFITEMKLLRKEKKRFSPDGTETKDFGSQVFFDASLKTCLSNPTQLRNIDAEIKYRIDANRLKVNLPSHEMDWLKDTVNTLAKP